ncbi:restriction endonuclease subunit S [Shewanella japonica]|uniref:restriction endonuclease subunit S n=1 Tax=Shewanella japonica TaxID=93973 RepID=UPI002494379E|nr:restriction endonuclease subunit S [Shewanella japonica]
MTDKETVKFGDICKEVKLTTKDPIGDGYERYIGLEHLDSGSLKIKRWGMIADDSPSFTRVFKKGHILFGKRRPYLKKAAVAEFDGVCSGDIIVLEPAGNLIDPELVPYFIQTDLMWDWAVKTASGSLSPRTKFKLLADLEYPFLSGSEQKQKKEILTKFKKLSVRAEETFEAFDYVFDTLYRNYFTLSDTNPNGRLGDVISGFKVGKSVKSSSRSAQIDEVGVLKVSAVSKGLYKPEENKLVTSADELAKLKVTPSAGDLLITRANTPELVGDSCLVNTSAKNVFTPDKIWVAQVVSGVDKFWLLHLLQYLRRSGRLAKIATGTSGSMKNISQKKMLDVDIYIPTEEEQIKIGTALCDLMASHESLINNQHERRSLESLILGI